AQSVTCQPGSYVSPDAATSYAFADGVHPSGAAHGVLAGYATSVLEAPRQMAVLANSAAMTGRARAERVGARLQGAPAEGAGWWVDLRGDFQRYDHGTLYDGAGPALTLGADWNRGNLTDRKSTRLNSSHVKISYAVFSLKKKKTMGRN